MQTHRRRAAALSQAGHRKGRGAASLGAYHRVGEEKDEGGAEAHHPCRPNLEPAQPCQPSCHRHHRRHSGPAMESTGAAECCVEQWPSLCKRFRYRSCWSCGSNSFRSSGTSSSSSSSSSSSASSPSFPFEPVFLAWFVPTSTSPNSLAPKLSSGVDASLRASKQPLGQQDRRNALPSLSFAMISLSFAISSLRLICPLWSTSQSLKILSESLAGSPSSTRSFPNSSRLM